MQSTYLPPLRAASQLVVHDPASYVQAVKQRLHEKAGIPPLQQRLIFKAPPAGPSEPSPCVRSDAACTSPSRAIGESHIWQAILFRGGKAIGRLVTPEQRTELLGSSSPAEQPSPAALGSWSQPLATGNARDCPIESSHAQFRHRLSASTPLHMVQLTFGHWRPTSRGNATEGLGSLHIPVDEAFQSSDFRIQVIGSAVQGGSSLAVPISYSFSGKAVGVELSLFAQQAEYRAAHRRRRAAAASLLSEPEPQCPADARELLVSCGEGVECFSLLLDISDEPAWLKRVVLSFALLDAPSRRPATCGITESVSLDTAASVARRLGSPTAAEHTSSRVSGARTEQGNEPSPLLSKSSVKRSRKQGKKRTRLRAARCDDSPQFARLTDVAKPAPELRSFEAPVIAAGKGLSDSSAAVLSLADAQPSEGATVVASCSGVVNSGAANGRQPQSGGGSGGGGDEPDGSDDDDYISGGGGGDWGPAGGGGGDGGDGWRSNPNRPPPAAPSSDESDDTDTELGDILTKEATAAAEPEAIADAAIRSDQGDSSGGNWSLEPARHQGGATGYPTALDTPHGGTPALLAAESSSFGAHNEQGGGSDATNGARPQSVDVPSTMLNGSYNDPHAVRVRDPRQPDFADPRSSVDSKTSRPSEVGFNVAHLAALSSAHGAPELALARSSMAGQRPRSVLNPMRRVRTTESGNYPARPLSGGTPPGHALGGVPAHTVLMPKLLHMQGGVMGRGQVPPDQLQGMHVSSLSWNGLQNAASSSMHLQGHPPPPFHLHSTHSCHVAPAPSMLVHPPGMGPPGTAQRQSNATAGTRSPPIYLPQVWHVPPPPPPPVRSPLWTPQPQSRPGSSTPAVSHSLAHPPPLTLPPPAHPVQCTPVDEAMVESSNGRTSSDSHPSLVAGTPMSSDHGSHVSSHGSGSPRWASASSGDLIGYGSPHSASAGLDSRDVALPLQPRAVHSGVEGTGAPNPENMLHHLQNNAPGDVPFRLMGNIAPPHTHRQRLDLGIKSQLELSLQGLGNGFGQRAQEPAQGAQYLGQSAIASQQRVGISESPTLAPPPPQQQQQQQQQQQYLQRQALQEAQQRSQRALQQVQHSHQQFQQQQQQYAAVSGLFPMFQHSAPSSPARGVAESSASMANGGNHGGNQYRSRSAITAAAPSVHMSNPAAGNPLARHDRSRSHSSLSVLPGAAHPQHQQQQQAQQPQQQAQNVAFAGGLPQGFASQQLATASVAGGGLRKRLAGQWRDLPKPPTDLERFLAQITPVLTESRPNDTPLRLADLWQFYLEPSLYGQEVYTVGGSRGPGRAYYVPLLSGLQLFCNMHSEKDFTAAAEEGRDLFKADDNRRDRHEGHPGGSKELYLLAQHSEGDNPYARPPLYEAVQELAALGVGGSTTALFDTLLADLHPASWYAVAWYPVYRIPDAPLTARFLTFHSITPRPLPHVELGGRDPSASRHLCLMASGLMWDNVHQDVEHWLERYHTPPSAAVPAPAPERPRMPEWELANWDVESLRRNAARLASGAGLCIMGSGGWRPVNETDYTHNDFEFFKRRMRPVV